MSGDHTSGGASIGSRDRKAAPDPASAVGTLELLDRTVVVIGGDHGVGLEIARRAGAEGAALMLIGADPGRLAAAASCCSSTAPARGPIASARSAPGPTR
jgi:hypothetical protein